MSHASIQVELSSYLTVLSFVFLQFAILLGLIAGVEIGAGVLVFMRSDEVREAGGVEIEG